MGRGEQKEIAGYRVVKRQFVKTVLSQCCRNTRRHFSLILPPPSAPLSPCPLRRRRRGETKGKEKRKRKKKKGGRSLGIRRRLTLTAVKLRGVKANKTATYRRTQGQSPATISCSPRVSTRATSSRHEYFSAFFLFFPFPHKGEASAASAILVIRPDSRAMRLLNGNAKSIGRFGDNSLG
jgi:hypothetical protein